MSLLFLRKFTYSGLFVCFDNIRIYIYELISKESCLLGIYKKRYGMVEIKINKASVNSDIDENKIVAYVTARNMTKRKATETVEACETEG